jgi:hypothetical protein
MAHVQLTLEEYEALRSMISSERESEGATLAAAPKKKKRKVSKYSKEFGIQLKKLIKKHPRTKVTQLMSKAHAKTRSAMKS